ncbi:MAG: hypothetical protein HGA23_09715, partial [Bacteroidales bacterium]|nr:hypothetical protein [Bacteroidales bacterium]
DPYFCEFSLKMLNKIRGVGFPAVGQHRKPGRFIDRKDEFVLKEYRDHKRPHA